MKPWKQAARAKRMRDAGTRAIEAAKLSHKHDKPVQVDVTGLLHVLTATQDSGPSEET